MDFKVKIKKDESVKFADPGPLGMASFGITTVLLGLCNTGIIPTFDSSILALAIIFGGFCQALVGVFEFLRANTFGTLCFTAYGFFWIGLAFMNILPHSFGLEFPSAASGLMYSLGWLLFTFFMLVLSFKMPPLQLTHVLFSLLFITITLLCVRDVCVMANQQQAANVFTVIAGVTGSILGSGALYSGGAQLVNIRFGKVILPVEYVINPKDKSKKK